MAARKRARKGLALPEGSLNDQNARRAARAGRALAEVQNEIGLTDADGLDTAITDLICDLMHLCDRGGLEIERILRRARMHHDAEIRDAEDEPIVR